MSTTISGWQSAWQGWVQAVQTANNNRSNANSSSTATPAPAATPTPAPTTVAAPTPAQAPVVTTPSAVVTPATASSGADTVRAIPQQLSKPSVSLRDLYDKGMTEGVASMTTAIQAIQTSTEATAAKAASQDSEAQRSKAAIVAQAAYGIVQQAGARQSDVMGLLRKA